MATIEEVATSAGVSIATVSRVMNNSYVVSREKREKVLEAARALNYQTSRSQLRQAASRTILVVGSVFVFDIVAGIKHMASEHGFDVLFYFANRPECTLGSIGLISRAQADGLILLNYLDRAQELSELLKVLPIVHCGDIRHYPDARIVSVDNRRATMDAMRHIFQVGRRRIGLLLPDQGEYVPDYISDRKSAYRMALDESGLPFDPSLVFHSDLSPEGFDEVTRKIQNLPERPDALFCANDLLGAGIVAALLAVGITVPSDMAVVGFDNDDISELCRPALTTIAQPRFQIGVECVRQLIGMINGDPPIGRQVYLAHELIIRGSTVA